MLVRPSYVLGGRGMEIVFDDETLSGYVERATIASPEHPVLVDRFLDDAIEIEAVDVLHDGVDIYVGGIMEHIEEDRHPLRRLLVHAAAGHPRRQRAPARCGSGARRLR